MPFQCALCSASARFLWVKEGREVYRCGECGYAFVHPPPDAPLRDDFSHSRAILAAAQHFKSEYVRFLSRIEAMTAPGSLLDIGCNIGLSLVVARERGWNPMGIELSPEAARYGREKLGVQIIETPLEDAGFPEGELDAVVMYHTLEHVVHPFRMLSEVARILKPGGVLYASVPNGGGISAFLLREKWEWVSADHVSYFDKRTLRMAIEKCGLLPALITSYLGARGAQRKSRLEAGFLDRISDFLCLSISLESWSEKPSGWTPQ